MIKILHIFSCTGGGISTWIKNNLDVCCSNERNDAMAFLINNDNGFIDDIRDNGGQCFVMPRVRHNPIKFFRFIKEIMNKGGYDVIHCHFDGVEAIPFWLVYRKSKCKNFIIHIHRVEMERFKKDGIKKKLCYKANQAINKVIGKNALACSEKAAEYAFGYPYSNKVTVLYNGIKNIDPFETPSEKNKLMLLCVAGLRPVKNLQYAIEIADKLRKKNYNFELNLVGSGIQREYLNTLIIKKKLEQNVFLRGYCSTPNEYYKKSDILLLPSISEGFAIVAIEAQAYSCYVIASQAVSDEVNLGINKMAYIEIGPNNVDLWVKKIKETGKKDIVNRQKIAEILESPISRFLVTI